MNDKNTTLRIILACVVALVFLVVAAIVALFVTNHADARIVAILIGLISPIIMSLLAYMGIMNANQTVERVEKKVDSVNSTLENGH